MEDDTKAVGEAAQKQDEWTAPRLTQLDVERTTGGDYTIPVEDLEFHS